MSDQQQTDVVIIGAGPVGLFAVFECGMLGLSCQVVDSLESLGGQCAALYPEKPIYDIPGYPEISGRDLIAKLREQAAPFFPAYHLGQRVEGLSREGDSWRLETSKGLSILAKVVIIAAGAGAFGPNRPPLENLEAYEGSSVFYMVGDPEDFRGEEVVIAGGGDSALDWALVLADIAKSVMVVHRRPKFRGAPDSVAKLHALAEAGKIQLVTPYQLDSLEGDGGQLSAVIVRDLDGEKRRLSATRLLPFFGLSMNLGPIANWGLALDKSLIEVEPTTLQSSQPGIFAIGDIAGYPNKLKLILCGFSEAALAAHTAHKILHPDEELHWEYSTTKGLPGSR